jgi:hypothetical protein
LRTDIFDGIALVYRRRLQVRPHEGVLAVSRVTPRMSILTGNTGPAALTF